MLRGLLVFFLLIFGSSAFGQTLPTDLNNIDEETLNYYVLLEVNALRKRAKVDSLQNNSALLPAAQHHVDYLVATDELRHFQKNKKMYNPKNRVDAFGGQFPTVGENLQFFEPKYEVKVGREKNPSLLEDYERMAKYLVQQWRNSKPHYANIISSDYKYQYTTFGIDKRSGKLYACQLFGGASYEKEATEMADYELKPEKDKKCKKCFDRLGKEYFGIERVGDSVYFYSDSKKSVKKVLRNPFVDGLAYDLVSKSQFECGADNKLNGLRAVNGQMQQPIYRKSFYKKHNLFRRKRVNILLGAIPEDYRDSLIECNLIVLKKKRTCSSYLNYNVLLENDINLDLAYKLDTLPILKTCIKRDTIKKRVYFGKSNTEASEEQLIEIQNALDLFESKIDKATIQGFSSVEGSTAANKLLYEKRAQRIMEVLGKHVTDSSKISINSEENWDLFKKDIAETQHTALALLSLEKLKDTINNSDLANTLEPMLSKHRYADLILYVSYEIEINLTPEELETHYDEYIANNQIQQIKRLQANHYRFVQSGKMTPESITDIEFPITKKYSTVRTNAAVLRFNSDSLLKPLYEELIQVFYTDETNKLNNTNLKIIDFYMRLQQGSLKELIKGYEDLKSFSNMDRKVKSKLLLQTGMFIDVIENQIRVKRRTECSKYLKKVVKPAKLTNEETFQVARYFYYVGEKEYAYELTRKIIDESNKAEDFVFFMKLLITLEDDIARKKYIKYFLKVKEMEPDNFCEFFIPPTHSNPKDFNQYINFQILDDPAIKELYCDECGN